MGNIREHRQEIDGKLYVCKTFPASEGLIILPRLISLLGENVANLVFGIGEEEIDALMADPKLTTTIFVRIAERAEQNDGLLVLRDLMKYTTHMRRHQEPGQKVVEVPEPVYDMFDDHFAGNYMHLLNVAMWVGRASFGNP